MNEWMNKRRNYDWMDITLINSINFNLGLFSNHQACTIFISLRLEPPTFLLSGGRLATRQHPPLGEIPNMLLDQLLTCLCCWLTDKPEETEMADLFLREAVLMKDFQHAHVLGVVGITFDPDGSPMVILPFMYHGDMRKYIMNSELVGYFYLSLYANFHIITLSLS